MSPCKEDAFNDLRSETLQLIRIHTETYSACYHIIEDYDSLALEREVTILTERMSRLDLKTRELVKQLARAGVDEC